MKVNYETVEKLKILSKVISLDVIDKNTVKVRYNQYWSPDYVTMGKAKELSKQFEVKIFG